MCVAVSNLIQGDQSPHITQRSDNVFIHFVDVSASELASGRCKNTVLVDKVQCAYAIERTDIKVVDTMIGCRVHSSGTSLDGYVLT